MSHTHKIDEIDKKILEILQSRAKITNARLSEEIGLSPAPTLERVKKLEQMGIITSYHAKLNIQKLGLGVTTFVLATLNGHNRTNIESFVREINKISCACDVVTFNYFRNLIYFFHKTLDVFPVMTV